MKRVILTAIAIMMMLGSAIAADVKNDVVKQSGNRMLMEFDVIGEPNENTEVTVTITIKGEIYTADKLHLEGDFGKIKAGKGKKIYWNVLQDFPRGLSDNVKWKVEAGGKDFKDPVTGMEMVYVKGGCFQMGDTFGDGYSDEKPVHEVCLDDFYIGKYEVTQGQWKAIMGNNHSSFKDCGDNCPVEQVSWNDAQEFIKKLNQKTGKNYKLPTEAEWEYAAKSGGKNEEYAGGNDVDSVAWYKSNSGDKTHPVGQKKPNGLGLYDMSGNVWEWVEDWYDENYYKNSPKNNPKGPNSGMHRVVRGGSWDNGTMLTRSAGRDRNSAVNRYNDGLLGFRLLLPVR